MLLCLQTSKHRKNNQLVGVIISPDVQLSANESAFYHVLL